MKKQLLINNYMQGGGLIYDVPPVELPPSSFNSCLNIDFRDNAVRSSKGYEELVLFPGTGIPSHIQEYDANISYYYVVTDQTNAYSFDGSNWNDITGTPFTGNFDNRFSSMVAGNVLVLTNGIDPPQYWNQPIAGGGLVDLIWDGSDTWRDEGITCKTMKSFKNFYVAGNVNEGATEYPHRVMWSDPTPSNNIPLSWDYSDPTTLAGWLDFDMTDGIVVDIAVLNDKLIVFKDHSTYVMSHTTGQSVFTSRLLSGTQGILGKNCYCQVKNSLICLVDGDIVANNGSSIESIVEGKVRKLLFDNISGDTYDRSFVVHNVSQKEVWFAVPVKDGEYPSFAVVWSYENNTWSIKSIPIATHMTHGIVNVTSTSQTWDQETLITWDDNQRSWGERTYNVVNDRVIGTVPPAVGALYATRDDFAIQLGLNDSRICVFDQGNTLEGYAKRSVVERTDLAVGGDGYSFLVTKVIPRITGTGTVTITIGSQEHEGGPVHWHTPKVFDIENDRKLSVRVGGMYLAYKVESADVNEWALSGIEFDYRVGGKRRKSYK